MNLHNKKIELIAPAGNLDSLNAAISEGADAVYLGLKSFNARERAKNFSYREIEAIIDKLHSISKKVYITLNTIFEEREKKILYNILKFLNSLNPDAVIIQDLGLLHLINNYFKDLKIHASTQMNISTTQAVNFLSKYGVKRVILSRELSFNEIKNIRENTNLELEVFVHGALCISASGLCLFSSYLKRKSANRGQCIQPCRAIYNNGLEKKAFFSPKDLMLIDYIPDLIEIGINSLKIEGRMKNANYVATVVKAYRYLIDNYSNNKFETIEIAKNILKEDFAREKTSFLFLNKKNDDFLENNKTGIGLYVGKIKKIIKNDNKITLILPKDENLKLSIGDLVRIHSTDDKKRISFKITEIRNNENEYFIISPHEVKINDSVYLLEKAVSRKKYHRIIPKNLNKYKKHPGNLIPPEINKRQITLEQKLTNGIYIKLHSFKDIFTTQSVKLQKVILHLNDENYHNLINEQLLKKNNISKNNIILYLEPYLFEDTTEDLKQKINILVEKGYYLYILNNLAHISLLPSRKEIIKISGPYLYTFNSYAIDFLLNIGFNYIILPLENNKKNIIASTEKFNRKLFFLTIFSFPELFYITSKIENKLLFSKFSDQYGHNYDLVKTKEKIVVIPENPFSITDKIDLLRKYKFEKFIIDFSNISLRKNYFKNVIKYLYKKEKIPQSTRYNWKNGFLTNKSLN